jgi:Family of unknown function (DUF5681)
MSATANVGCGRPPKSTQFKKGSSGNPRGRPRGKRRDIPHDHLLGQMVTIREDGRERRITAAEAFLLQLTKKGLEGCSSSARASLASIEQARQWRRGAATDIKIIRVVLCCFGLGHIIERLGMGIHVNRTSKDDVKLELKPWIVQAAVDRMKPNQLNPAEQRTVLESTRSPQKIEWPDWWSERG